MGEIVLILCSAAFAVLALLAPLVQRRFMQTLLVRSDDDADLVVQTQVRPLSYLSRLLPRTPLAAGYSRYCLSCF